MTGQTRPMTGYHMLMILIGFFGVVIAVNSYMAFLAVSTFTGTVVDNSYVASQQFNCWLNTARSERALGWHADIALDPARHIVIHATDKSGRALAPLDGTGVAGRALVNAKPIPVHFMPNGAGVLRSVDALPDGRWQVRLVLSSTTHQLHMADELR